MSQLLQQERPRRPRSAAYRRFGERREEGGAGPGNVPDAAAAVPARLLDTPHDIIMRFEYALRDAADPKAPPVPLRDLVADLGDIANTDNLPLLKYYVTPDEWRSFASGAPRRPAASCLPSAPRLPVARPRVASHTPTPALALTLAGPQAAWPWRSRMC